MARNTALKFASLDEALRNAEALAFFEDQDPERALFIEYVENLWLQHASPDEKMRAYFGSLEQAQVLFDAWKNDESLFGSLFVDRFPTLKRFQ